VGETFSSVHVPISGLVMLIAVVDEPLSKPLTLFQLIIILSDLLISLADKSHWESYSNPRSEKL